MPEASAITLATPIEVLPGMTSARVRGLASLGLTNLGRLVAHLPTRHERLEAEAPIAELVPGQIVSARGEVTATRVVMRGRRPRFEAVLVDPTGRLDLTWFNATYLRDKIHPGMRLRVQGKSRRLGSAIQVTNPTWSRLDDEEEPATLDERLRPVYPATEGFTSRQVEAAIASQLGRALPLIEDHLPEELRRRHDLPALAEAYRMMHAPETDAEVASGRRRLAYDELLLLQLGVAIRRRQLRETLRAPALRWSEAMDRHIRERFPFALTPAQDAVVREIAADLSRATPTNRLIQGDVGSGKTVVALYAMLMAVASGHQAALMAPTEILAEQHFASMGRVLAGSRVRVELLTGGTPEAERESILERLARGEVDILIGTHALVTGRVAFASLAVAVIDEQHRFGVHQRAALRTRGTEARRHGGMEGNEGGAELTPHVLVMTATPIPRTLAITLFGDLDVSTITASPPGRQPVATRVVPPETRGEVYAWVRTRLEAGEQAFIVVPAIDGGAGAPDDGEGGALGAEREGGAGENEETSEAAGRRGGGDVRSLLRELEAGALVGTRVAGLHGRLKRATREAIMERFRAGLIDALVATTVIEVGVDVPNATVMVVEHAERFGLAQLHQLRGRVGRGSKKSACVLIGETPTEDARARLEAMATIHDGFVLAEKDLELRGPGELFGTRQSGAAPLRVADLARDLELLKLARQDAMAWIARSPKLDGPGDALVRRRMLKAHGKWLGLGDVG